MKFKSTPSKAHAHYFRIQVRDLRPRFQNRLAQNVRMALTRKYAVSVVVQHDARIAPKQD